MRNDTAIRHYWALANLLAAGRIPVPAEAVVSLLHDEAGSSRAALTEGYDRRRSGFPQEWWKSDKDTSFKILITEHDKVPSDAAAFFFVTFSLNRLNCENS
jgi:hypothetical protein